MCCLFRDFGLLGLEQSSINVSDKVLVIVLFNLLPNKIRDREQKIVRHGFVNRMDIDDHFHYKSPSYPGEWLL